MRVFIDTNVFISAIINPSGSPALVLEICAELGNIGKLQVVVCDTVISELRRIVSEKFPGKEEALEKMFAILKVKVVSKIDEIAHVNVRDPYDETIVRSAMKHADILITGDKDILQCEHDSALIILTPRQFLKMIGLE